MWSTSIFIIIILVFLVLLKFTTILIITILTIVWFKILFLIRWWFVGYILILIHLWSRLILGFFSVFSFSISPWLLIGLIIRTVFPFVFSWILIFLNFLLWWIRWLNFLFYWLLDFLLIIFRISIRIISIFNLIDDFLISFNI